MKTTPDTTLSLIDSLWNFSNPSLSESRFREAADQTTEVAARLELLTQLARAQGLQRRFEDAHATLDDIERTLQPRAADASFADARTRLALERGRVFNSADRRAQALPLFEHASASARESGNDHLAIDAAHMVAIVHGSSGRDADALDWNRRALELAEASSQPRARQWLASLSNNIGWSLHDAGNPADALPHFQHALTHRLELNNPADIRIARWCIGRCLRSLNRIDEALAIQRDLLAGMPADAQPDGFVHEELAECLLALDRADDARPHFAQAHRLLFADLSPDESQRARLHRLAKLGGSVPP